ncbi:uncharacterized protein BX664DRAFT_6057 [Halteromyces radiatus]|uniref:uncharacterized protein n=1 Tax=Halteromyces radiatus TaxID=101107 RepID=UPI002220F324|nr:uncharacterized protein BX664DRAFT_6057 [Halteromyces radiatus]KAI8098740.1 hypothetical protein BX664DRAFT_6057 [Halteromyces radiatus]
MSAHISTFSDSDLSLHLSEGSTLSSESDHSIPSSKPTLNNNKKKKSSMADKKKKKPSKKSTVSPKKTVKPVKEEPLYCICRQPYDGKAFMIECDNCQGKKKKKDNQIKSIILIYIFFIIEWFHGQCVGINPKSVIKHYYCDNCQKKIQDAKATNAKGKSQNQKKKSPFSFFISKSLMFNLKIFVRSGKESKYKESNLSKEI